MKAIFLSAAIAISMTAAGCGTMGGGGSYFAAEAAPMAAPSQLQSPAVIEDNSGKYMSPYTSDEVVAEWVDKAVKAEAGAALGGAVGSAAGQVAAEELLGGLGMFGSMLGDAGGKAIGRRAAIKAAGGMEFIKDTSDLSFASWEDLSVFLYVEHSHRENYADVLSATQAIYTELADGGYEKAIRRASKKG